ncbi:MAG: hypothetical protein BGO33_07900 [Bacteroidia bacterium 43-41]|nr:MAG: hypothetical protein BGO33_07900 [Bacteroidia bacterium 43-41]
MKIKSVITNTFLNFPGWHTPRKIVVIESDDWGSIRMPSKEVKQKLQQSGIMLENDPYSLFDTQADDKDLEALFEVLCSVKDKNGRYAVMTADTNVANPDFDKIKASDYQQYFYEPFTYTLKRNPDGDKTFQLWKQGIASGVFYPQSHGREHVNVRRWLHDLREKHANVRLWFDMGSYGTSYLVDKAQRGHYMTAFDSAMPEDIAFYNQSIEEGLNLFESIFGYRSESFIATTYCWPLEIEPVLIMNGVKYLQGTVIQNIPVDNGEKFRKKKNNFQGVKSKSGLIHLMRNVYFEPAQNPGFDWIGNCLRRIDIAFRCSKPATISMHRLNVIGRLVEENRTRNLALLKQLLKEIVKRWPDVEFMNSAELGRLVEGK